MAKLTREHGAEGPASDPYSYTETTFEKDGKEFTIHAGLGVWVKENGKAVKMSPMDEDGNSEPWAHKWWLLKTGLTFVQTERLVRRMENPTKCRGCGSRKLAWMAGYPGETFLVCRVCGEVLSTTFNEGAVI